MFEQVFLIAFIAFIVVLIGCIVVAGIAEYKADKIKRKDQALIKQMEAMVKAAKERELIQAGRAQAIDQRLAEIEQQLERK
jgi:uncharacterized protein HemX